MKEIYADFLFSKGYFVRSESSEAHTAEALVALAKLFDIRIVSGAEMASLDMIRTASRNLGENVPEPFYKGFPESVRELTPNQLFWDQLIHYITTYGLGLFSQPGHSLPEQEFQRSLFAEETTIRPFHILSREAAEEKLRGYVDALLDSSRPLSDSQYALVREYVADYAYEVRECPCKDTIVRLLLDTGNASYATGLALSGVIRLVEQLQYEKYGSKDIKALNLRNQDRKFLCRVLDRIFEHGKCDTVGCYEKRRLWAGLLHHIHYKPVNKKAEAFVRDIRSGKARSAYAEFEALLENGRIAEAVDTLIRRKGTAALLRNLNYILSRCRTEQDVACVMENIRSKNKIVLIQLLLQYSRCGDDRAGRVFKFTKFNKLRIHTESISERQHRKSHIPLRLIDPVCGQLQQSLEAACKGTLGKVYIDEGMKYIALPLQENTSMGGVGVLPRGSRIPIAEGKKLRAFTYWEKVNDIDLSVIGITDEGLEREFSWRTMAGLQSDAITFSGDQTSGYQGGSEYYDIILPEFIWLYPRIRYLIFCDNVYSNLAFSECFCKAGYMFRDEEDSGEIFEPKTVRSSFRITCDSTFAYLFALDLEKNEFIWLNTARDSSIHVAGISSAAFLLDYMDVTAIISLYDLAAMMASEIVDRPEDADIVFSDQVLTLPETTEQVRSCDFEKVLSLLNK